MKKIFIGPVFLLVFILGFAAGFVFSAVRFNSSKNVVPMNVGSALPVKAEQVISGLKSYLSQWKGRLEILSQGDLQDSLIIVSLYDVDPVNVKGLMISDSSSKRYYPPEIEFEADKGDFGFNFSLEPFYVVYSSERTIAVLLDQSVLEKRVALQAMSSSATPFTTVLFSGEKQVFSSDEAFTAPYDTLYAFTDTGSVWTDGTIEKYWKKFQIENVFLTIVIHYGKDL
ncbi:hypothetical protein JXL83_06055 [candidate division WOR-3 bacterium]|nr:hypothetical protein [candidate division WOR-3 bacterium]